MPIRDATQSRTLPRLDSFPAVRVSSALIIPAVRSVIGEVQDPFLPCRRNPPGFFESCRNWKAIYGLVTHNEGPTSLGSQAVSLGEKLFRRDNILQYGIGQ